MMTRKNPDDALPMYSKISLLIRNRIQSGQYERGQKLPTEDEFVKEFGASKITIRHALSRLAEEGLIERFRGRGTFVAEKLALKEKFTVTNLHDIVRALESSAIKSIEIERLQVSETRIPREITNFFNLSGDDTITRVQRVIWHDKVPIAFHENYLTADLARHITKKNLYRKRSIIKLLKEEIGLVVGKGEMYFEAVGIDGEIAPFLHCQSLNPVINIRVFFRSDSDEPIEIVNYFVRSEYFKYKVVMDLTAYDLI
jgi:DNA-binding GntR family transcriptional regulator